MAKYEVFTAEHRRYLVNAKSKKEANRIVSEEADLSPKDKRVRLIEFGDFEIVNKGG